MEKTDNNKIFECKVCLDLCKEPVVTLCGHLYCWECIYEWSKTKNNKEIPCPFCNCSVNIDKLIPLYVSPEEHSKKEHTIPPRPRNEIPRHQNNPNPNNNFEFQFNTFGFNFAWRNQNQNSNYRILFTLIPFLFFLFFPSLFGLFTKFIQHYFLSKNSPRTDQIRSRAIVTDTALDHYFKSIIFDDDDIFEDFIPLLMIFLALLVSIYLITKKMIRRHQVAQNIPANAQNPVNPNVV